MQRDEPEQFPTTFETTSGLYYDLRASWYSYCCPGIWGILVETGNRRVRTRTRRNRLRRNILRGYYCSLDITSRLHRLRRMGLIPPCLGDTFVPRYHPKQPISRYASAGLVRASLWSRLHCALHRLLPSSGSRAKHPKPCLCFLSGKPVQFKEARPCGYYRHPKGTQRVRATRSPIRNRVLDRFECIQD